jgi:PAS domain S-box-containing protein
MPHIRTALAPGIRRRLTAALGDGFELVPVAAADLAAALAASGPDVVWVLGREAMLALDPGLPAGQGARVMLLLSRSDLRELAALPTEVADIVVLPAGAPELRLRLERLMRATALAAPGERRGVAAEAALNRSKSLLQATLDATADGILVVDRAGGVVGYNRRFLEMWRIPQELAEAAEDARLLQHVLNQLSDPDAFIDKVRALYADAGAESFDVLHFRDGRTFERYSAPQRIDGEPAGRVWSFRDVTEREAALRASHESETRLRLAMQTARVGVWEWWPRTGRLWTSGAFEDIFGLPPGKEAGSIEALRDSIHPDDRDAVASVLASVAGEANQLSCEYRAIRSDGATVWLSTRGYVFRGADGAAERVVGVTADVTPRRQAEMTLQILNDALEGKVRLRTAELTQASRKLQETLDRLRALLDGMPDMAWLKDAAGRYIAVNQAFAAVLGRKPLEFIGCADADLGAGSAAQTFLASDAEVMSAGREVREEHLWHDAAGRVHWLETLKVPIRDEDGDIAGCVGIARDVTERHQHEDSLRALNSRLELANQEMEAFSYSVAHDLRAPLRAITGFSQILQEELGPLLDAEHRGMLGRVVGNAMRMGQLIDDLLELARVGRRDLEKREVDMQALAREVADEALGAVNGGPMPALQIGTLAPAWGDPILIRQALANLVGNAVKFTANRPGPRIEIGSLDQDGGAVEYFVRDNGAGFDPAYGHKLFRVFERLHDREAFEGTGVGLAIVARIAQRHGGSVAAQGAPEAGARFAFVLPRKPLA